MRFEWTSDDDGRWDERRPRKPDRPRRRRWPYLLLALALLSVLGFVTWEQVQRRVGDEVAGLEADVRASHELAQEAARRGDAELFTSLLSGRSPEWTAAQQTLLEENLLFGSAGRALGLQPLPDAGSVTRVEFSPDLREAQLTVRYAYAGSKEGDAQPLYLKQTLSYRMGARGWLLSPPDETYWGPQVTREGLYVTLSFQEREAQVAERLLSFLDETLARVCDVWKTSCPPASALHVRLAPGVQTLPEAREIPVSAGELTLPALSLVGIPADTDGQPGAAERALFRGYAAQVVAAANADLLAFKCCRQRFYFEALQRQELHHLGLGERPLAAEEYVHFVDDIISLPRLNQLWWWPQRDPPSDLERRQIDAFVAFLLQETSRGPRYLQEGVTDAYGFWAWLREYTPYDPATEQAELTSAWHNFIMARANEAQSSAVQRPPAPEQTLWLTCQNENGQRGLFWLDVGSEQLMESAADVRRFDALVPVPGDRGLVLFDNNPDSASRFPARLFDGAQPIPLSGELVPAYSLPADPQGRYLTMWRVSQSGRTIDSVGLLDTEQCEAHAGCPSRTAPGLPFWSPDGERVLFWETTENELLLSGRPPSSTEEIVTRDAGWPFWLDEHTFGYVADELGQIMLVEADGEERPVLRTDELLSMLPGSAGDRNWQFASIIAAGTDALVGAVTLPGSSAHHFFLLEGLRNGERNLHDLLYVPQLVVASPDSTLSPDGRWLSLHLYPDTGLEIRFILHDVWQNETVLDLRSPYFTAFHAHDWSAEGRWLARLGNGYLELLAPPSGESESLYRHFVPTTSMQCSSLAWVDG